MLESLAEKIEGGAIYTMVVSEPWVWPTMEIIHFVGLSLLLGALLVIDLRLLGFFRGINVHAIHSLLPWVLVGFLLNLITGVLFFFGDPFRYAVHTGFQLKMVLILFAGLNAAWYVWTLHPVIGSWAHDCNPPPLAKTIAALSLATWTAVLLLGRLIPYVSTG